MQGGGDTNPPNQPMSGIEKHNDHDVLCGRGGGSYKHLGNSTYRHLVNLNKELYLSCKKHEKIKISQAIVSAIRRQNPSGRFLEKDAKSGLWYDIGDKKAVEKTSQALREGAPKLRQLLNQKGGDSGRDLSKSPVPNRSGGSGSGNQHNEPDPGRKRKKEEADGLEASAANIAGSLHNHMMQGHFGVRIVGDELQTENLFGNSNNTPLGSHTSLTADSTQNTSDTMNFSNATFPSHDQQQNYSSAITSQMQSFANNNMDFMQSLGSGQFSSAMAGVDGTVNGLHPSAPQSKLEHEDPADTDDFDVEPDPIPFSTARELQAKRRESVKASAALHEAMLAYDNDLFVPRHSMFRDSTQSILTDFSDMLASIRSFDPEADAFDDDLMIGAGTTDPLTQMSSQNHLISGITPNMLHSNGGRSRPSIRYGDMRRSSRSTKRDSLISIMSDITDISAALSAVQMEDDEENEDARQGQESKIGEGGSNGKRRQSVVRFNVDAVKSSSRRGGFAINEFMAQDVTAVGGKKDLPRRESSLLRSNSRYTAQDINQAASSEFINDTQAWNLMQQAQQLQMGSFIGSKGSGSARGSLRSSSVRFSLPAQEHFDLTKIVNADGRGSFYNALGPGQRGSFVVNQRRDTASSLLRRSVLSNLTAMDMSFLNEEDLSDDENDFGDHLVTRDDSDEVNTSGHFANPMMVWNAADSNVRHNLPPGSH